MKRIVSVHIVNFQSHTDTTINFTKGLNAIVGQSDQGKTAIFRAIKWALYNRPLGSRFVTKGQNYCSVEVVFDDGTVIRRYKKGNSNFYDVTLNTGKQWIELTGFGTKVPSEVMMAHGMRQIILLDKKKKSLNLSEQLDPPFLLSESPAQKGAIIGRLLRTEITDRARKNVQKDIRNTNKELDELKSDIDKKKEEITAFDYLEEFEKRLNEIQEEMKELKEDFEFYNKIEDINIRLNRDYDRYKNLSETIKELEKYNNAYEDIISCIDVFRQYDCILNLKNGIDIDKERAKKCLMILEENKNIEKISVEFDGLYEDNSQYDSIYKKYISLKKAIDDYIKLQEKIKQLEKQQVADIEIINLEKLKNHIDAVNSINENKLAITQRKEKGLMVIDEIKEQLDQKIKEYKKGIAEFGKCPICFSEMDEAALRNVTNNLF